MPVARCRMPQFSSHFHAANALEWEPPRQFRYAYTLLDCVPEPMCQAYVERLLECVVEPGGRLIVGDYGSRSRGIPPRPVAEILTSYGRPVAGSASGGDPPVTRFAWVDRF